MKNIGMVISNENRTYSCIANTQETIMKTQEEIKKEIEALKAVRPKVCPRSIFGDDNLASLDAQVKVLENDMDDDDIYDMYDHAGGSEYVLEAALYARQWIDDEVYPDDSGLADDCPLEQREE